MQLCKRQLMHLPDPCLVPTLECISHTAAEVIFLKHTSGHLFPLLKMCFSPPPQLLQYAIKALPILWDILIVTCWQFHQALLVFLASLMLFLLPVFPSQLSSPGFRPRSRTTSPISLLQDPRLGSVPIHPLRASMHFSLPLSKSHHICDLPLDGRGQVSLFWVLLAPRIVPAHSRHSLRVC